MDVAIVEEAFANGLAGAALEEHVVGQDDGGAAVDLEEAADVLEEVELLVAVVAQKSSRRISWRSFTSSPSC